MKIKAEAIKKDNRLTPFENDGVSPFTKPADRDFVIMQITDVHIGGGFLSSKKPFSFSFLINIE